MSSEVEQDLEEDYEIVSADRPEDENGDYEDVPEDETGPSYQAQLDELKKASGVKGDQDRIDKLLASMAHQDGVIAFERLEHKRLLDKVSTWAESELATLLILADRGHFEALKDIMPSAVVRLHDILGTNQTQYLSSGGMPAPAAYKDTKAIFTPVSGRHDNDESPL